MAASDQTCGRFRPDMPNVWLKYQNGVSNYPTTYQINAASRSVTARRTFNTEANMEAGVTAIVHILRSVSFLYTMSSPASKVGRSCLGFRYMIVSKFLNVAAARISNLEAPTLAFQNHGAAARAPPAKIRCSTLDNRAFSGFLVSRMGYRAKPLKARLATDLI